MPSLHWISRFFSLNQSHIHRKSLVYIWANKVFVVNTEWVVIIDKWMWTVVPTILQPTTWLTKAKENNLVKKTFKIYNCNQWLFSIRRSWKALTFRKKNIRLPGVFQSYNYILIKKEKFKFAYLVQCVRSTSVHNI